jgi:hypothetical protein
MKCVILAALFVCAFAMVSCSTDAYYEPEYDGQMEEVRSVRTKRSPQPHFDPASLAFLGGVAAGGIFGPILYNRLYGNQGGWSAPVVYSQGWEAPQKGW